MATAIMECKHQNLTGEVVFEFKDGRVTQILYVEVICHPVILKYSSDCTLISLRPTNSMFMFTKVDEDTFRLSGEVALRFLEDFQNEHLKDE